MDGMRNIGRALRKMFTPTAKQKQEQKKPELKENRAARRKYIGEIRKAARGKKLRRGGYYGEHGHLNLPSFGMKVGVQTKYGTAVLCYFKEDLCFHAVGEPYKFGRYEIVSWAEAL